MASESSPELSEEPPQGQQYDFSDVWQTAATPPNTPPPGGGAHAGQNGPPSAAGNGATQPSIGDLLQLLIVQQQQTTMLLQQVLSRPQTVLPTPDFGQAQQAVFATPQGAIGDRAQGGSVSDYYPTACTSTR